jgi:YidC/Oxa1 family membrane protein insertase
MGFLDPIARLLGTILSFFFDLIPSFGVAIILLTVVVNLLLFPLTLKQTRSMRSMQDIQPEIKRLQKEHKGDRERLNKELMALYQERGVNPAAGCLPMLIQLPIWFALYRLLQNPTNFLPNDDSLVAAYQRGDTKFLGLDLKESAADVFGGDGFVSAIPFLILIAIVMATGYYQQWQTMRRRGGAQPETQQQQTMQTVMKIFPVFFGFISWGLPAGLVLYFAASQLVRIGQQSVILRMDDRPPAAAETKPSPPSDGESDDETDEGVRPQPRSKKKKRKRRRN